VPDLKPVDVQIPSRAPGSCDYRPTDLGPIACAVAGELAAYARSLVECDDARLYVSLEVNLKAAGAGVTGRGGAGQGGADVPVQGGGVAVGAAPCAAADAARARVTLTHCAAAAGDAGAPAVLAGLGRALDSGADAARPLRAAAGRRSLVAEAEAEAEPAWRRQRRSRRGGGGAGAAVRAPPKLRRGGWCRGFQVR
jgi:hypothetical protein